MGQDRFWIIKRRAGEFPGGPVVRTWCSHCWGPGSIPGLGTKIPQASQCGQKKRPRVIGLTIWLSDSWYEKEYINIVFTSADSRTDVIQYLNMNWTQLEYLINSLYISFLLRTAWLRLHMQYIKILIPLLWW